MSRHQTRFELCDTHVNWNSEGRKRLAEVFCEGGPGSGGPCVPQPCRIFPGTDLFNGTLTDEEAAGWVAGWAVNT